MNYNFRKRTSFVDYSDDAGSQLKLTDLKKVVVLPAGTSTVCFTAESVLEAKAVLDDTQSSPAEVQPIVYIIHCFPNIAA
jgi:hypothetical protein